MTKDLLAKIGATLSLGLALLAPAAAAPQPAMVSIDRPEVNMRAGAGTQHPALWKLSRGYPLAVVQTRGPWLKVRDFENDEGWIYKPLTGRTAHHVVKAKVANVRQAPGLKSRIVGKAEYGDVMRTLERRKDWVKVRHPDGFTGWVSRSLLWGW